MKNFDMARPNESPATGVGAWAASTASGSPTAPSRAFCTPSTTIVSPTFKPFFDDPLVVDAPSHLDRLDVRLVVRPDDGDLSTCPAIR